MSNFPPQSGGLNAYEFYIEAVLAWHCGDCDSYIECTNDIREDELDAPYGAWAVRKGKEGMAAGWYVPPLTSEGSLIVGCLCPACARKRGLVISLME
jgi:hypothetical protein